MINSGISNEVTYELEKFQKEHLYCALNWNKEYIFKNIVLLYTTYIFYTYFIYAKGDH